MGQEDFAKARPASEVLPEFIGQKPAQALTRRGRGRPQKPIKKINQTLRLDGDVVEAYRQEGKGWQTRINELLRQHRPHRLSVR